jgi:phospholipase D1/2
MNRYQPFDTAPGEAWPLLRPNDTCSRIALAERIAFLVDGAAYFRAVKAAMKNARESIIIVAWDFHTRTRLEPDRVASDYPDEIGAFLNHLAAQRPGLDIRVLKWGMPLPMAITFPRWPIPVLQLFNRKGVEYRIDRAHPHGASHHQKIVVIDDAIAFCGGSDFCVDRWDTPDHRAENALRHTPEGRRLPARHDIMMAVDGEAARALGDLARERWYRAAGRHLQAPRVNNDPWPAELKALRSPVHIGIARTAPALKNNPEVREAERLCLAMINRAKRWLYLETQYFACPLLGEALLRRLAEEDGPEIVLVCSARAPSYFDHLAMDPVRNQLITRLRAADRHGRFRAYAPVTSGRAPIIVHSKIVIADDCALRVGSSNMNNRSMGFDTECDLCLSTDMADNAEEIGTIIRGFRNRLIGEHLATKPETVAAQHERHGSLIAAMEALNPDQGRRLIPVAGDRISVLDPLFTSMQLLDPISSTDSWRPWRRSAAAESWQAKYA